jgi:DNA-directed RNA polymerase specialized sigma24 family protein
MRAYEGAARVAGAINELRTEQREVLLALDDDLSERATAAKAKVPSGSVGYLARKARETIWRAWLGTTSWVGRKHR